MSARAMLMRTQGYGVSFRVSSCEIIRRWKLLIRREITFTITANISRGPAHWNLSKPPRMEVLVLVRFWTMSDLESLKRSTDIDFYVELRVWRKSWRCQNIRLDFCVATVDCDILTFPYNTITSVVRTIVVLQTIRITVMVLYNRKSYMETTH